MDLEIWPPLAFAVVWGIFTLHLRRRAMAHRTELGRSRRVFELGHFGIGRPDEFTEEGWRARNLFFATVGLGAVLMLALAVALQFIAETAQ